MVADEMAEEGLSCRNVSVKLKQTDFTLRQRAVSISRYIHTADEIYKYVPSAFMASSITRTDAARV